MSWKDILKSDANHKRVTEMAKKVLRELGLDEKYVDSRAGWLSDSDKLFAHIPLIGQVESEEDMYAQVTEKSLKDIIMANKGLYLPNLLNQDERFIQQKKEDWDEAGHEIVMELGEMLEAGVQLPEWAVVENNEIHWSKTGKKYIEEATRKNRHLDYRF